MATGDAESLEMVLEARNETQDALRQVVAQTGEMKDAIAADVNELNLKFQELDEQIRTFSAQAGVSLSATAGASTEMSSKVAGAADDTKKAFKETAEEADIAAKMVTASVAKMGGNVEQARARLAKIRAGFTDGGKGIDYATKALNNFIQKADRAPAGLLEGARLVSGAGAMLAKDISQVVQRSLGFITSGNWAQAGIFAVSAVIGGIMRKREEAAKEAARQDQEALKAAEKTAEEYKKVYEKNREERKAADEKYSNESKALEYKMRAAKDENFDAERAMAEHTYRRKKELLTKELIDANEAYAKAKSMAAGPSRTTAEADHKKAAAEAARLNLELAKGNMTLAQREYTLTRQSALFERQRREEEESQKIRQASIATMRQMLNERGKVEESIAKQAKNELFALGLSKEEKGYASDLLRIEELRGQGFMAQANALELVLNAKRAYLAYDKAQEEVEKRRKDTQAANDELDKRIESLEKATDLQGQINELAEYYNGLLKRGADDVKVNAAYHRQVLQLIEKQVVEANKAVAATMAEAGTLDTRLKYMMQEEQLTKTIAEAKAKGNEREAAAAEAKKVMLQFEEEHELAMLKRYEEVAKVRKDGTMDELEALKRKYDLEDKILAKKRDQAVEAAKGDSGGPKSARDFLSEQGIEVSVSGGKTRTNYGIQKRRDERARQLREENLARERGWMPEYEDYLSRQRDKGTQDAKSGTGDVNNDWVMEGSFWNTPPKISDIEKMKPPTLDGGPTGASSPEKAAADTAKAAGDAAKAAGDTAKAAADAAASLDTAAKALTDAQSKMSETAGSAQRGSAAAEGSNNAMKQVSEAMKKQAEILEKMTTLMAEMRTAQSDATGATVRTMPVIANEIAGMKQDLANQRKAMEDALKVLNGG